MIFSIEFPHDVPFKTNKSQRVKDWSGELCLAKLTADDPSDAPRSMRRAVAVATLAGRHPEALGEELPTARKVIEMLY